MEDVHSEGARGYGTEQEQVDNKADRTGVLGLQNERKHKATGHKK